MKNENAIDLFKFIFSLLIVAIHVPILVGECSNYNWLISNGIARIGVPYFFIAGSYFLFKGLDGDFSKEKTRKYFKKLLSLYIVWSIIYLIPDFIQFVIHIGEKSILDIGKYVFHIINGLLFNGTHYHLWYLNATIVCTWTVLKLLKCHRIILPISIFFFVIGLLCNAYNGLVVDRLETYQWYSKIVRIVTTFAWSNNYSFPWFWMIFIYIGYQFSRMDLKFNKTMTALCVLMSIALLYIELFFVDSHELFYGHSMMVSILPAAIFLFSLSKKIRLCDSHIYIYIRHLSTLIYLVHPPVLSVVCNIFRREDVDQNQIGLTYLTVVTISLFISMMIIKLSNFKDNRLKIFTKLYR